MISLRRIFGLMLLFFFFEAVVAIVTKIAYPDFNVFLACVAMTALAVAVWVVFVLVTRLMMKSAASPPPPGPRPAAATPAQRPKFSDNSFSEDLQSLIGEANRRMAGALPAGPRGETASAANLPLYLVVGAEGAGKTSAILNSGLEPQLLAGEATREGNTIPTRVCNFWFAEGSLLADISGRVFAQEGENWERALRVFSQPVKIARWKQILFGRRSESNLRGIILVCDASQFARAGDPQRTAAFARTLSDRLQMVGSIFRREFPVYVVFSKSDGVQYFPEFFAHLSDPEARRVLGATLPFAKLRNETADIYSDREGKRLSEFFNRLYMSLAEKRLIFLARETENAKKSTAYEFPRELKKLRGEMVQFLLDIFRPSLLHPGPRLRGFYLSGQRWVARNVAPVADGSMTNFTVIQGKRSDATVFFGGRTGQPSPVVPAASGGAIARWMFLTDLFHNIILKDRAGLAAPRLQTRDQEYRIYAFAGIGALLLLLCIIWANSWRHNRDLLNNVQNVVQKIGPYHAETATSTQALTDLDSLRASLVTLLGYQRHGAPFWYRWGLYSGDDTTNALYQFYFTRFRKVFVDPSVNLLTNRFLQLDPSAPTSDNVYPFLKTYRMVTSGTCKPDPDFLGTNLLPIWAFAESVSTNDIGALAQSQVQFYISELMTKNPYEGQIRENSQAVGQAQEYLRQQNGPDKLVQGLVNEINHQRRPDLLINYPADYGDVLDGPSTVDAAFTKDGWATMMDDIHNHKVAGAGEACVVGGKADQSGMSFTSENEIQVKSLYIDQFIHQWKTFLESHTVKRFQSTADAAQKLRILADNNHSPLLGLLYMEAHNTDLAPQQKSTAQNLVEGAKKGIGQELQSFLGQSAGSAATAAVAQELGPTAKDATDVVQAFAPLKFVVDPGTPDRWVNSNNQTYVQALAALSNSMAAMPAVIDAADPSTQQAAEKTKADIAAAYTAVHALEGMIPRTPSGVDDDLRKLLEQPIQYAEEVSGHTPRRGPVVAVGHDVKPGVNKAAKDLCSSLDSLKSKYPFNFIATEEATPQDLNPVFGPGGSLATFAQNPDVQAAYKHEGAAWLPNPALSGVEFVQPFVQSLNAMSAFQGALYADQSSNPHFEYGVTLDGTGKRFWVELNVDGQALSFGKESGHIILVEPFLHHKKAHPSAKLLWPPTSYQQTTMTVKAGQPVTILERGGTWSMFRLLQEADKQEGGVFVFNNIRAGNNGNPNPLTDGHGNPVQILIHVDPPAATVFGKGYFQKLRCENFAGMALR